MTEMAELGRSIVIGTGNSFRSDDAVGLAAAACLLEHDMPPGIEVIVSGTDEFGLIELFKKAENVVIIDAVSTGRPPGTVSVFDLDKVNMVSRSSNVNLHGFGLADTIVLAEALGISPNITIVGVEPQSTSSGKHLTPLITSKLPVAVQTVLSLIRGISGLS